jgi:hypothetical protein
MFNFDVGSGASVGTLWMTLSGSWYECMISGSSGSAALYVNQVSLSLQDNSLGYQLLRAGNDVYPVYLTGTAGSVSMSISQSEWDNNLDYKPHLLMKSISDGCFYIVSAEVSASVVTLEVNQNSKIFLNW